MVLRATTYDFGEDLAKSLLSCCKCLFPKAQFCMKERTALSRCVQKVSMDKTFVWSHSKQVLMNSHHTSGEVKKLKTKALSFHISIKIEIIFFKIISNFRKEKKNRYFSKHSLHKSSNLCLFLTKRLWYNMATF